MSGLTSACSARRDTSEHRRAEERAHRHLADDGGKRQEHRDTAEHGRCDENHSDGEEELGGHSHFTF
jgi:hypothetical protein